MRIRLRILRNEIVPVSVLWPVSKAQEKQTIGQLIEAVNNVFPLESTYWGLEEYVVLVGDYECLHWNELGAVCRDEDEVVIRPLHWAEVKARTFTGRNRISENGMHLHDGVPFGRPALRGPRRYPLEIPPRKRARLMEEEDEGDMNEDSVEDDGQRLLMDAQTYATATNGLELEPSQNPAMVEDESDEEDDSSFHSEEESVESSETSGNSDTSDSSSSDGSDGSESESDSSSASSESSSESSDDSSDSDSSCEASWKGIGSSKVPSPTRTAASGIASINGVPAITNGVSHSNNGHAVMSNGGSSNPKDGQKSSSHGVVVAAIAGPSPSSQQGIPFGGKQSTKDRNIRRRDTKKLKHLKSIGQLPQTANLESLYAWEASNGNPRKGQTAPSNAAADEVSQTEASALQEKRQMLLDAIASGGINITSGHDVFGTGADSDDGSPEEISSKVAPAENQVVPEVVPATITKSTDMMPASVLKRSKLDLANSKRLLFGSLGVRSPKTQEDRNAVQKKLAERHQRTTSTKQANVPEATLDETFDGTEDKEAWREKIDLDAVECVDEEVTLSQPPFPFYQHWDDQYRRRKNKQRISGPYAAAGKRKRKRGQQEPTVNGSYVETYDKYNTDGYGDALDYDDVVDDEYYEEGALLGGQSTPSSGKAIDNQALPESGDQQITDDFPPLPETVSHLPPLAEAEARDEDFVVFTELACSAATGWQPAVLTQLAQLLQKEGDSWSIRLPQSDNPQKQFNADGERTYEKFEAPDMSEDEDVEGDESVRIVRWEEMGEPRLLLRRAVAIEQAANQQEAVEVLV